VRRGVVTAFAWGALLFFGAAHAGFGQEATTEHVPHDTFGPWKVANTAIFVIVLGYLLSKSAPKFFNARSGDIQKAIKDATGLKIEADFRYSEIDRKMATLAEEVKKIRKEAAAEMEREHARVRRDTEEGVKRISHHVTAEIEAFRKEGMRKVRQQTAQSAVAFAERQLRDRMAGGEPGDLIQDFVHLVEQGKN
jgi:F-type H+-transporting ATPase subunit b